MAYSKKKHSEEIRVPVESKNNYRAPRMASLATLETRNLTTLRAGIWMVARVAGIAAEAGFAILQDELADAGQRKGVLGVFVGKVGQMFQHFGAGLFG